MDVDWCCLFCFGNAIFKVFPVSMSKVVAVILAVAAIVFLVGKWLASGIERGWN